MQLTHRFKVNIGDWSNDGHGHCDTYTIASSHSVESVQTAFKSAAERLGFLTYEGINRFPRFSICRQYEESTISHEDVQTLVEAGVKVDDIIDLEEEDDAYGFEEGPLAIAHILMRIAQLDQNFEYELVEDDMPNFNGFWSSALNMSAGYGVYLG